MITTPPKPDSLDNEGVDVGVLAKSWLGRNTKVLLFVLARDRVFMTENEVQLCHGKHVSELACLAARLENNLVPWAGQVGTKHNHPRSRVREFLPTRLEAILEQLDVTTTAVSALLVLHFILNHEGLFLEVDRGCKRGRDGVVRSLGLCNETLLANDERRLRVLDLPFADVGKGLAAHRSLFGSLRRRPAFGPVVGELLDEWGGDFRDLNRRVNACSRSTE